MFVAIVPELWQLFEFLVHIVYLVCFLKIIYSLGCHTLKAEIPSIPNNIENWIKLDCTYDVVMTKMEMFSVKKKST